jgi:hypothetical protein
MRGLPVARASSPDGRWAYTLYDESGGEYPFIHALDTETATARCIDLDQLAGRDDLYALSLHVGPSGAIAVRHIERERPLLVVDPGTFQVRAPAQPAPRRSRPQEDGGSAWPIVAAGLGLIVLVVFVRRRVRDNVQSYATSGLERDVVRADVGAAGGDGQGGARPAELERR